MLCSMDNFPARYLLFLMLQIDPFFFSPLHHVSYLYTQYIIANFSSKDGVTHSRVESPTATDGTNCMELLGEKFSSTEYIS